MAPPPRSSLSTKLNLFCSVLFCVVYSLQTALCRLIGDSSQLHESLTTIDANKPVRWRHIGFAVYCLVCDCANNTIIMRHSYIIMVSDIALAAT